MITKSKENHYFSILCFSGLQNDFFNLCSPFSISYGFLVSCKAISAIECQIFAKTMFLEFWLKFCHNLPVWKGERLFSSCLLGTHTGRFWLNLCQNSRNIVFAKIWHSMALMALQDTKKPIKYWKRPTKAEKVILKAGESKNGKIMIFFHFCDHLVSKIKGIQYFDVSRSKRPKRPH